MINDDLLAKFDRIQDLPVSEEMLGAYVEGNVSDGEALGISSMMANDAGLSSLYDDVTTLDLGNIMDIPLFESDEIAINSLGFSEIPSIDMLDSFNQANECDVASIFTPNIENELSLFDTSDSVMHDTPINEYSEQGDSFYDESSSLNPDSDITDDDLFNDTQDFLS